MSNPFRTPTGVQKVAAAQHAAQSKAEEKVWDQDAALNPLRAGSTKERVFDSKGEVNGYDNGDVLRQIAHLLQKVTPQVPGNLLRSAGKRDTAEQRKAKMEVIASAMKDPSGEGFAIVGQELLLPIKDIVDYEGWARKVYRVRPLNQGELFRIAKDVRSTAFVVGQDGQGIEARHVGKYITPDEAMITAFCSVAIAEIYQMNYDVLDRAQDTARQEIELAEDKRGLALLDRAARAVNTPTTFTTLGTGAFEDVRYQIERHRLIAEKFLINRQELSDIIKTMSTTVDPVTERELILAGYIGNYLNMQIITAAGTGVEEVVPAGTFYAVTGSEYLGEMGVRFELFSEPYNRFVTQEMVKGWAFAEMVGFGIPNVKSAAVGSKP